MLKYMTALPFPGSRHKGAPGHCGAVRKRVAPTSGATGEEWEARTK